MKKLNIALLFVFACYGASGQQFAINVAPRYSLGATIPARYQLLEGQSFLTPDLKTKYSGTLIGTGGGELEYNQNSNGWGLDVMFKFTNEKNGNAWAVLLGGYRHKYLQHTDHPDFSYKGYNLTGSYNFYRSTGLSAGLRRVLMKNRDLGWYFQINAMYSLQLQDFSGAQNKWVATTIDTYRYLESGTGTVSVESNLQPKTLVIAPEIGYTNRGNFGFEISLSYQQPIGDPLYVRKESYYQNNRLLGTEQANVTQQSLWLNFRLPINVFKRSKIPRAPKPPKQYEPKPQKTPKPTPQPQVPIQKFQDLCITVLDEKTQRPIANAKAVFEGKTYYSNNEGKILLIALRVGKKGTFSISAANYEGGDIDFETAAQMGCQPLNVQLTPIPPPPAVEINGQSVKKGESIVLNAIEFDQGKSDLLPAAKAELDKVAEWMRKYPTLRIELSGHTSNEGDYDENVRLSQDRVAVCKRYVAGQIAGSDERIKTVGYGPSRPRVPNSTPENRRKNRRVELKIESL